MVAFLVMAIFAELRLAAPEMPLLRRLELMALDLRFRLRGPIAPGPEIVIVMIDDSTVAELGRWPLPRRKFADAVDFLSRAGAKVIGIDILFAEAEPTLPAEAKELLTAAAKQLGDAERRNLKRLEESGDEALAAAIRRAGNVVLPFTFRFGDETPAPPPDYLAKAAFARVRVDPDYLQLALRSSGVIAPVPVLGQASAALGHTVALYDVDGSARYDYPVIEQDLDDYPSMALRLVQLYLGVPWDAVGVDLGKGVTLGSRQIASDPAMRIGVNCRGKARTYPTYPFSQVAAGALPEAAFRDRIVLVGADVLGIRDTFQTPFTTTLPGVERLATIVDGMLHGQSLRRPGDAPWLEAALMLAAALAMGLAVARLSIVGAGVFTLGLVSFGEAAAQFAFSRHALWYAGAMPAGAAAVTFGFLLFYRYGLLDKEHRRLRRAFSRYLAPGMVARMAESAKPPELGGELREITVMFCDLRGFSALSERLDPHTLTRVVNTFLSLATEAVLAHGGTVDKYIGDAVMAFWNAPVPQRDHAELACRSALVIVDRMAELNARRVAADEPALAIGIGINTGQCTVGNFGSEQRFDYSAMGDGVNVAARLEGESKAFGVTIALGPETAARVSGFAVLPLDSVQLRGRAQEVEVSALVGDELVAASEGFAELRRQHLALREAVAAADWPAAARLLASLRVAAPATVAPLNAMLAARLPRQAESSSG